MFQPTRPVRGATHGPARALVGEVVSTHAPRAGRDLPRVRRPRGSFGFNPRAPCGARRSRTRGGLHPYRVSTHAPRAGRDWLCVWLTKDIVQFQPTRPVRGATARCSRRASRRTSFNPRAPCGARPRHRVARRRLPRVSTHAPRAGRDAWSRAIPCAPSWFQPTRPVRGATAMGEVCRSKVNEFQPTRPVRGATSFGRAGASLSSVSTHAPRAGRDLHTGQEPVESARFQPTRPVRGAT